MKNEGSKIDIKAERPDNQPIYHGNNLDDISEIIKKVESSPEFIDAENRRLLSATDTRFFLERLAENEEEFQIVYSRERNNHPGGDLAAFSEWMVRKVNKGVEYHINHFDNNLTYLTTARRFIEWISQKKPETSNELTDVHLIKQASKVNDVKLSMRFLAARHLYLLLNNEGGETAIKKTPRAKEYLEQFGYKSAGDFLYWVNYFKVEFNRRNLIAADPKKNKTGEDENENFYKEFELLLIVFESPKFPRSKLMATEDFKFFSKKYNPWKTSKDRTDRPLKRKSTTHKKID